MSVTDSNAIGCRMDTKATTDDEGIDPLTATVREAWPEGLPEDLDLALATMTATERRDAGERLSAVLDYVARKVPAADAAKAADMSSVRLRQLAQAYRRGDARTVLGIRANAGAERPEILLGRLGDAPAAIEDAMRALVRSRPGLSSKEALKAVRELDLKLPSDKTLSRWLARVRRSEAAGRTFGRRIAFDVRPLRLRTHEGRWHLAAFALDVGGGLVMGASVVDPGFPLEMAYRAAAGIGERSLAQLGNIGAFTAASPPSVTITASADDQALQMLGFFADVAAITGADPIETVPGRAVAKVCGVRLGRLALETGNIPPGDDVPATDGATASKILAKALATHHEAFRGLIAGEEPNEDPDGAPLSLMLGRIARGLKGADRNPRLDAAEDVV